MTTPNAVINNHNADQVGRRRIIMASMISQLREIHHVNPVIYRAVPVPGILFMMI
jgi:hypothetical protein